MSVLHSREKTGWGKVGHFVPFACMIFGLSGNFCRISVADTERPKILRIAIDQAPTTINPRHSMDALGQRLGALMFSALTRIDSNLEPRPDLAEKWEVLDRGKQWRFRVRAGLTDQAGQPITPALLGACFEHYRAGKPTATLIGSFPHWVSTKVDGDRITFVFSQPNPYFARDVSLLRYFRNDDQTAPCLDPPPGQAPEDIVGSGPFRLSDSDDSDWTFKGLGGSRLQTIEFRLVRDANALVTQLITNKIDLFYNYGSMIPKLKWLQKKYPGRFMLVDRPSVNVFYLAFNLEHPILKNLKVRQAIRLAIPRQEIADQKFSGIGEVEDGFLSKRLPEALQFQDLTPAFAKEVRAFDPTRAEKLLDEAGFPRKAAKDGQGIRFSLRYRTGPFVEGRENALILQHYLGKIGIRLILEAVEPAVLLASLRKGTFDLAISRWVGVSDASILGRTLHSKGASNRARYRNPEVDRLLDAARQETDLAKRRKLVVRVQKFMLEELPYHPLWSWKNILFARKGILPDDFEESSLSLSGGVDSFLMKLR